jgi:DNA primase
MFEVRILSEQYNQKDPDERTKFQKEAAKKLAQIDEVLERNNYIEAVSNLYMIDKKGLSQLVGQYGINGAHVRPDIEREPAGESRREKRKPDKENMAPKLLLTWMINEPELVSRLDGIISQEDFEGEIYQEVAEKLFNQYRSEGKARPAAIINTFDTLEAQRLVAEIMQTNLEQDLDNQEIDNAITDVVKKIKLSSIEKELAATNDIGRMQQLIKEKAKTLKLHISLKNG